VLLSEEPNMSSNAPTIAVGIATLDRYPYVEALLDDLARQTRLPDEVLIVDQTPAQRRQNLQIYKWNQVFPLRIILQEARGTTGAKNRLLRECRSAIVVMPDDDVRLEPDYIRNHVRHFADDRIDVVSGPVYEWDAMKSEWYVKWENHFMLDGPTGRAFMSVRSFSGGNSSVRVASALAIGGWDENIATYGEDNDFQDRLDYAGAVCMFDPAAGLRHLRASRGGERDTSWGNSGHAGNWHVLAGYFYYFLMHRPLNSTYLMMKDTIAGATWNILNGHAIGLRVFSNALIAVPLSIWRWCRGPLLIDPDTPNRQTRRFTKREVSRRKGMLACRYPRTILAEVKPPGLLS
jgi:GT2 family glycosyltransferase